MYLKDKKLMPPPWLAYPEIERYSIGWRMGYGEDYIGRFFSWLEDISSEELVSCAYLLLYGAIHDGSESGAVWRWGDSRTDFGEPGSEAD